MGVAFLVVALIFYFGYLIDWKELLAILGEGGLGAVVVYLVVAGFITAAFIAPNAASHGAAHH